MSPSLVSSEDWKLVCKSTNFLLDSVYMGNSDRSLVDGDQEGARVGDVDGDIVGSGVVGDTDGDALGLRVGYGVTVRLDCEIAHVPSAFRVPNRAH